jgi:hypothetical protein
MPVSESTLTRPVDDVVVADPRVAADVYDVDDESNIVRGMD